MAAPFPPIRHDRSASPASRPQDWRCSKCFKLLGKKSDGYLHIHFARGHQYTVATPVTSVCRCCGKLNTLHS